MVVLVCLIPVSCDRPRPQTVCRRAARPRARHLAHFGCDPRTAADHLIQPGIGEVID